MAEHPEIIGNHFKIEKLIGYGGMGEVYRGVDTRSGEAVAIKYLKPEVIDFDPEIVKRFEREGEALRQLNHPNIVKVLATIQEEHRHYIVLEYVSGGSLADVLKKEERLSVERTLEIALDLSDALTRAHRLKIIHRDIKPHNVLIAEDGTPRLTDFGTAHLGDRTQMTQTGTLIGTYAYLSPEACSGELLDERADIWSFGVMIYEMLTGQRPFQGDQPMVILTSILKQPVPDLTEFRPETPLELVGLVNSMLVKDRDQRISSVRLVGANLEAIMRGEDLTPSASAGIQLQPVIENMENNQFNTFTPSSSSIPNLPPDPLSSGSSGGVSSSPSPGPTPSTSSQSAPYFTPYFQQAVNKSWREILASGFVWIVLAIVVFGAGIAAAAIVVGNDSEDNDNDRQAEEQATSNVVIPAEETEDRPAPSQRSEELIIVDPVNDDEMMVLIADFAPIADVEKRDVGRFLTETLENSITREVIASSPVQIRRYNAPIHDAETALAIAEANDAAVMVWGRFDEDQVVAEVQIGDLEPFANIQFERELLERAANVRVRLPDEHHGSVAAPVLGTLYTLHLANSDAFEAMRILHIVDRLSRVTENTPDRAGGPSGGIPPTRPSHNSNLNPPPTRSGSNPPLGSPNGTPRPDDPMAVNFISENTSTHVQRHVMSLSRNETLSLGAINAAVESERSNPLLMLMRSLTHLRQGNQANAQQDALSAKRMGDYSDWVMPNYLLLATDNSLEDAIDHANEIIEIYPNDWYALTIRGMLHMENGNLLQAQEDFARAIEHEPQSNVTYVYAALLALQFGDFDTAARYTDIILRDFPDPTFYTRLVTLAFGENAIGDQDPIVTAFINFSLGQYAEAVKVTTEAIEVYDEPDASLFIIQGLAHCALENYAAAEETYTEAIETSENDLVPYMLRAEVRQHLGDTAGTESDLEHLRDNQSSEEHERYFAMVASGETSCEDVFSR
jgi:serine/threonine protein kinase/tetratricopeptide (TPR) repeat protein